MLARFSVLVATALAFAPVCLADVLTVGPAGSGAMFEEIQAAVGGAAAGDVVLVQPGTYSAVTVRRSLRILGNGTGPVIVDALSGPALRVEGLQAGTEVVVSAMELRAGTSVFQQVDHAVELIGNAGTVVLHDVLVEHAMSDASLLIESCSRVFLLSSRLAAMGSPDRAAVEVEGSTLLMADSKVIGDSTSTSGFTESGAAAVGLLNSDLQVWRSTLQGGDASGFKPKLSGAPEGGAGVASVASTLQFYGGPEGSVLGGEGGPAGLFGAPGDGGVALSLMGGSVAAIQSDLSLVGGLSGDGVTLALSIEEDGTSSHTFDSVVYPTLQLDDLEVARGQRLGVTLEGNPNGVQVLLVSKTAGPGLDLPGIPGPLILNLTGLFQVATVILEPNGTSQLTVPIPMNTDLLGNGYFLQTVEVGSGTTLGSPLFFTITE